MVDAAKKRQPHQGTKWSASWITATPFAFVGQLPMPENGGTHLSPDEAVNPPLGIWFPYKILLTKLLKNEVPAQDVAASGGLRRWRCWNHRNIGSTRRIAFASHKR